MAVTSIMSCETIGRSGHNTITATSGIRTTAAHAQRRDRRTAQQQRVQAATANSVIHHIGAGTRRSAVLTALMWPMTLATPCNSNAVAAPGNIATQGLRGDAQNVMR